MKIHISINMIEKKRNLNKDSFHRIRNVFNCIKLLGIFNEEAINIYIYLSYIHISLYYVDSVYLYSF